MWKGQDLTEEGQGEGCDQGSGKEPSVACLSDGRAKSYCYFVYHLERSILKAEHLVCWSLLVLACESQWLQFQAFCELLDITLVA